VGTHEAAKITDDAIMHNTLLIRKYFGMLLFHHTHQVYNPG